jgi:hypothetical protein
VIQFRGDSVIEIRFSSCLKLETTGNKGDAAMKMQSFAQARALSREFFPTWSRRARARWVLARLHAPQPKVPISAGWSHDMRAYWYQRVSRA